MTFETRSVLGFKIYRLRQPLLRRLAQLIPGLVLFGAALALTVEAGFGTNPWTVLHQGLADRTGLTIGSVAIVVSFVLLIVFRVVGEPLGLGTILNALIIGVSIDVTLWLIPDLEATWLRLVLLGVSPAVLGLGSGLYIGAGLGPGSRDGLMTALARRGLSLNVARTIVEVSALTAGWLLGGDVGIGTVWFGVTVGWFVNKFLKLLDIDKPEKVSSSPDQPRDLV